MTTTLEPEAIANQFVPLIQSDQGAQDCPIMLVLQPVGNLDQATSAAFQQALEDALHQAREAVVVDLLWVDAIEPAGIVVLLAGIRQATALGKFLTFQAMDKATRSTLTEMWNQQQETYLGCWDTLFEKGLESYLDQLSP